MKKEKRKEQRNDERDQLPEEKIKLVEEQQEHENDVEEPRGP